MEKVRLWCGQPMERMAKGPVIRHLMTDIRRVKRCIIIIIRTDICVISVSKSLFDATDYQHICPHSVLLFSC